MLQDRLLELRKIDFDVWRKTSIADMSLESLQDGTFFARHTSGELGKTNALQIRRRPSLVLTCGPVATLLSDVEIGLSYQWVSFGNWLTAKLATLPPRAVDNSQQCWWQANGRAFRLLDLPFELRSMIYRQLLGLYIWPHKKLGYQEHPLRSPLRIFGQATYTAYTNRCMAFARTSQYSLDPIGNERPWASINTNIQYICKQVRAEFRKFTVTSTVPHFRDPWTLIEVLPSLQGKWLRHISLGFPNSIYFRFLGYDDQRQVEWPGQALIRVFGKIPTLARLHLHFQVSLPRWIERVGIEDQFFSHDPWVRSLPSHPTDLISCQKTLLDWFFTLALEDLRQIPSVTMSGHVKLSTRTKWETILHDERNGTLHDLSAERLTIMSDYLRRPL